MCTIQDLKESNVTNSLLKKLEKNGFRDRSRMSGSRDTSIYTGLMGISRLNMSKIEDDSLIGTNKAI